MFPPEAGRSPSGGFALKIVSGTSPSSGEAQRSGSYRSVRCRKPGRLPDGTLTPGTDTTFAMCLTLRSAGVHKNHPGQAWVRFKDAERLPAASRQECLQALS